MKGSCEAAIDWDDTGHAPRIIKCGKPGKLYQKFILPFGVILCDECYQAMEAKHAK